MGTEDELEIIGFDLDTEPYQLYHDWESKQSLSTTVISAIAAVTNTPPTEVEPLYNSVNPDALNTIFEPLHNDNLRRPGGAIELILNDCKVTVHRNGMVKIYPLDEF